MPEPTATPAPTPPPLQADAPRVVVVHTGPADAPPVGLASAATFADRLVERDAKADSSIPTPRVDRVQDEVMTATSPEGRPPTRHVRRAEWKWFLIGGSVLALAAVVWAVSSSVPWPTLLFVAALLILFLGAAIPTWGAGLLRGGEERQARKVALLTTPRDRPT
ncbi:MAG: hypothetical protein ACKVS8_03170 [Phycisphaerales bacterium]